jgi:CRP-like cAMP-binding protein
MQENDPSSDHSENRLLDALPRSERIRLIGQMTPAVLRVKTVLFEPEESINAVHFPLEGVISLVTILEGGSTVEVATVGNEGIVGVPLVTGGSLVVRAISQVPGRTLRMPAAVFLAEFARPAPRSERSSRDISKRFSGRLRKQQLATGSTLAMSA